jgi:hypothetical protein
LRDSLFGDDGGFLVKQKSKLTSLPVLRYVCADWRGRCPMQRRRPFFAMQGEPMDAEPARLIIEALKEEKIDLYVTLRARNGVRSIIESFSL